MDTVGTKWQLYATLLRMRTSNAYVSSFARTLVGSRVWIIKVQIIEVGLYCYYPLQCLGVLVRSYLNGVALDL